MKRIILSTGNEGKIQEIKNILKDFPFAIIGKHELNEWEDPEENGETLEENARIKARAIQKKYPEDIIIADDTGLFIEALDGAPGIYSARYAGKDGDAKANREKILTELQGIENRNAYFETVIAVIDSENQEHIARGRCEGTILTEEHGERGFGYDSVFSPKGYQCSFAEMSEEEKNQISHRYHALLKLKELLWEKIN